MRLPDLAEAVLDPRRLAAFPSRLELVADPVDLVEHAQGQVRAMGIRLVVHDGDSTPGDCDIAHDGTIHFIRIG